MKWTSYADAKFYLWPHLFCEGPWITVASTRPYLWEIAPAPKRKKEELALSTLPPTALHKRETFLLSPSSDLMHYSSFFLLLFPFVKKRPSRSTFPMRTKGTTHERTSRWRRHWLQWRQRLGGGQGGGCARAWALLNAPFALECTEFTIKVEWKERKAHVHT